MYDVQDVTVRERTLRTLIGKWDIRAYTMVLALAGLWVLFSILTGGMFILPRNLSNLFEQSAETAVLAVGMTLVIVCAEIDLSVGSLCGLAGGIAAICQVSFHWNTFLSVLAGLAAGLVAGLWQGWWVAYRRVPSFIVTLGGMLIFRGILIGLTNGTSIAPLSQTFMSISQTYLSNMLGIILGAIAVVLYVLLTIQQRRRRIRLQFPVKPLTSEILVMSGVIILVAAFVFIMNLYSGIPMPVFILIVVAAIFTFIASRTRFGRHLYAIGGNREAARISGIPVKRRVLLVFALSGLLAGLTGVLLVARMGAGTADAGTNYELDAIAACVIGGSSLLGGIGTIPGSIIGALVMGSINNGMSILNAAPFWEYVVPGLVIIVAVWFDMSSKFRTSS
ncbi:sugar ABC transporter permease [Alicyclobacillus cycloheptanicus]|uniref:Xylose transport system permease protein XylH n=1 Tax=Alicyclobacillus cycloheptanicus TaxID=1457 RepID=A0ABT9XGF4_9BACL|nr:sugar ABC transporter permease [Alicyclobacillus cycloheptanicus]MDQ0189389.1 D-xylose transport system permease protein [Alicyclobacillus cycloheptanicus]WDM02265.1 sugar ABC transporter permease [Alicyclobacillus cycloheptanicus]